MSAPITLNAGAVSAVVEPAFGGRITAFRHGGTDVFAPVPADGSRDLAAPASCGCFPLVPWSNRIRDARLTLGDDTLTLPVTEPSAGHAIHGHGLRRAWMAEGDGTRARLHYAHAAGAEGWPWPYRASQVVSVDDDGMTVTLAVANAGEGAMPVGLGLHPYFPRTAGTRLTLPVETSWPPTEADKFPVAGGQPVPPTLDRREPGPVPMGLDQGFGGWSAPVRIAWPEQGLALTMSGEGPLDHLIVYTPTHRDYFCVEPVTHAIDAANLSENQGLAGTGHRLLAAGGELSVTLRFRVEVL
jgi:aldose 1-epimerase